MCAPPQPGEPSALGGVCPGLGWAGSAPGPTEALLTEELPARQRAATSSGHPDPHTNTCLRHTCWERGSSETGASPSLKAQAGILAPTSPRAREGHPEVAALTHAPSTTPLQLQHQHHASGHHLQLLPPRQLLQEAARAALCGPCGVGAAAGAHSSSVQQLCVPPPALRRLELHPQNHPDTLDPAAPSEAQPWPPRALGGGSPGPLKRKGVQAAALQVPTGPSRLQWTGWPLGPHGLLPATPTAHAHSLQSCCGQDPG